VDENENTIEERVAHLESALEHLDRAVGELGGDLRKEMKDVATLAVVSAFTAAKDHLQSTLLTYRGRDTIKAIRHLVNCITEALNEAAKGK
jgi:hypothetical protein